MLESYPKVVGILPRRIENSQNSRANSLFFNILLVTLYISIFYKASNRHEAGKLNGINNLAKSMLKNMGGEG
jgi:hypothetical protein